MNSQKSQTATEYLVILGVVVTIAVITVGTLSDVVSLGGLVGYGSGLDIYNSYSIANITSGSQVGGLIGRGSNAEIHDSYAISPFMSFGSSIGGLVGDTTYGDMDNISNSYWVNWSSFLIGPSQCVRDDAVWDGVSCLEVTSIDEIPSGVGIE